MHPSVSWIPSCPAPHHGFSGLSFLLPGTGNRADSGSCAPPVPPALRDPAPGGETSWGLLWGTGPKPVRCPGDGGWTDGLWHPSGVPKGNGVTQGWDVLAGAVRAMLISVPSAAEEAPAAPAPSESGAGPHREGRGRTGRAAGEHRAERRGGGSRGSAAGLGAGPAAGTCLRAAAKVRAPGSEPCAELRGRRGSPAASPGQPGGCDPAPGRSRSERRTLGDRDEAIDGRESHGSRCSPGWTQCSPDEGSLPVALQGLSGTEGTGKGSKGRGLRAALLWERRASSSSLVLMAGDTA